MNFDYDVVIVGAGPIGSTLAFNLAKENLNICLIDKKRIVGLPLQCAGIVSKSILDYNLLPNELILNEAKGAFLHSPNHCLKVAKDKTEAFIIDRVAYDQFLLNKAIGEGVDYFKESKVIDINSKKGIIKFNQSSELKEITAKIIVGADGSNSFISKKLANEFKYFNATQYLVKLSDFNKYSDFVDIYARNDLFPGFIWVIPTHDNILRVGLFSNHDFKQQSNILNEFFKDDFYFDDFDIIEKYHGKIPIYDKNKTIVKDRVILIGDAASQLKPTTGGGLILGFDAVKIAKKSIIKSLNKDDFSYLTEYSKEFKDKYSKELNYQIKVQKTLCSLSDDDLDYFFIKLKEKGLEELISEYGDMDKQSVLVKEFIKRGFIFSLLPSLLGRKISKIWSLKQ